MLRDHPIAKLNRALWGLRAALHREVRRLNDGGCGHFAYRAAQAVQALGFETEVVTPGHDEYDAPANGCRNTHHLAVRIRHNGRMYTFDSQTGLRLGGLRFGKNEPGRVPNASVECICDYPFGLGMSPDEAEEFVQEEAWNSCFDTRQLPRVEELIHQYLH